MATNYYAILGVRFDATDDEIRAAYRDKTIRYHPDHYGEDREPFLAVQEAFATLSDPQRREDHDRSLGGARPRARGQPVESRRSPVEPMPAGEQPQAEPLIPEQPSHVEPLVPEEPTSIGDVSLTRSFETFHPSFEEIFERLWSNFGSRARPKGEKLESLTIDIPLSREEALRGGTVRILVPARTSCPTCAGRGGLGPYGCWRCSGTGSLTGEYPLAVRFPPGVPHNYTARVSLERLGIRNLYLTCCFRITG